jgi:hypothetical protein
LLVDDYRLAPPVMQWKLTRVGEWDVYMPTVSEEQRRHSHAVATQIRRRRLKLINGGRA